MAGYTSTYDSTEISEPVVDLIITVIAGLVSFGTLIALVFLWGYLRNKGVKFG